MKRLASVILIIFASYLGWVVPACAQGRGATDWFTDNSDAQRSSWVRTDPKISSERLQKPGFQLIWKLELKSEDKGVNSLTAPALMERLIGYRGFRMLAFVGGSSNRISVIDTDLGRIEWEKQLAAPAKAQRDAPACPGGMTASATRPTVFSLPSSPFNGAGVGFGRSGPAHSAVGEPGEGAVTLAAAMDRARPSPGVPAAPAPAPAPASRGYSAVAQGNPRRGLALVYALSSDGKLHIMHLSNGADYHPPVEFLPPNANANGLIVIEEREAYVVTEGNCGGTPNGVWALDIASGQVATWKANVSGAAGPAFDENGTLYVTTGSGGESPNSLVALEPKTLKVKGRYTASEHGFSSSPVIFQYEGKTLIAAATSDGRIHLLNSEDLSSGKDNHALLYTTPASATTAELAPGALASWQEANGTRWILSPTENAIVAWKIVEQDGHPALQKGWTSPELVSPLPPSVINGVVFATSSGEFRSQESSMTQAERLKRSSHAVIYALDGATGKELWNSGTTINSFTRGGALSGGTGQIYLGTYDGSFYSFGFPIEH